MVARDLLLAELTGARYPRGAPFHDAIRRDGRVRQDPRRDSQLRSHSAPFRAHRPELANYDSNYKMKPPLRCRHDVEAVIEGIVDGVSRRHRNRSRAARRQRKNAGVRALPVRHYRA